MWSTPRKARDLRDQLYRFNQQIQSTTTQRHLFQKVQKAFDEKEIQLATSQQRIRSLEAQVEAGRARKRKKVNLSPNSKFANIEAIQRAQLEAGEAVDKPDESSESDLPSELGSCIIVALEKSV